MNVQNKKRGLLSLLRDGRQFWLYDGDPADGGSGGGGNGGKGSDKNDGKNDDKSGSNPSGSNGNDDGGNNSGTNKSADDKSKGTELPDDVKAQLAELAELKKTQQKAQEEAAKKADEERQKTLTTEQRLAELEAQNKKAQRDNAIYKVRERLGMTGGIYGEFDGLVKGETESEIETSLSQLKEKFSAHIEKEVEARTGKKAQGGDTAANGEAGKEAGGAKQKAEDYSKAVKAPTGLASSLFGSEFGGK